MPIEKATKTRDFKQQSQTYFVVTTYSHFAAGFSNKIIDSKIKTKSASNEAL